MEEKNFPPPYLRRPYLPFLDDISPLSNHWPPLPSNFQSNPPLQQDLSLKPFYDDLTKGGLAYVYAKNNQLNPQHYYHKTTSHRKHVIIIGAGMAGLSAAFELAQAGHEVTILELQHRVGGRVKTIKDAFADGLHAEDWKLNPGWYCSKYWPGWDIGLTETMKAELAITGIDSYFTCTVKPVIEELIQDPSPKGWEQWVSKWSKMSVLEFLESDKHQDPLARHKLRPWPNKAIEAYRVRNYMPLMRASLVEYLRELIGKWWKDPMYTPVDGMENLAWAFTRENRYGWNSAVHLSRVIHYGVKVQAIEEVEQDHGKRVKVTGRNETSKQSVIYTGHAVIVTVPLTVLRQMRVQLSREKQQAIEGVYYEASTKILLQCRTRFWQKADNLQGGFSKTNLPIGQLHYPDWEESRKSSHERGILVIYTWAQEAEMFGAQTPAQAIENAVNQVATIHPEIRDNFEVGAVQAWFSDPSSQGAFVYLRPNQYNDSIHKLLKSEPPVFLAGEGLSWSNGWIQGAMESGLRAAYEFYCYNEQKYPPEKTTDETCQLHYPDWEESRKSSHERGILVIYTWAQEAEMFGAQTPAQAIENAVNQVATIHPEIRDNFEVGAVQAWFSDPSSQGAFVYLRPNQYNDSIHKLLKSEPPVFLAGEGLSWSNGWIQGAMESGLRAAYEFYCYNEQKYPPEKTTDETCQCMQGTMHAMHLQNGMWC